MKKKKKQKKATTDVSELSIKIDYARLASEIVAAQQANSQMESAEGNNDYWRHTISGKIRKNYLSLSLSKAMSWLFFIGAALTSGATVKIIPMVARHAYAYFSNEFSVWYSYFLSATTVVFAAVISMLIFCILFNMGRELKRETHRDYIISVFSGLVSFAALVVALVALLMK